jgi:3-phenylpropionate/trans-cinnamate dioxygenase ferredoxin reductase subunit
MFRTFVVVGAGQAGAQALESLRREGFCGRLVLIGDEPHTPYQRPPLSKKFLGGQQPKERLFVKPASFYSSVAAVLRLGTRVESIDAAQRELHLPNGERLSYDRLLLATGALPRPIDVPGARLNGVHYLRTIADVENIRAQVAGARHVVVVGGGYIGLEVAATCRQLGAEVDVLEMADRVMNRVVAPEVSAFFAAQHARMGVRIHAGLTVSGFEPRPDDDGCIGAVTTLDGRRFAADMAVVGIGVVPATALAAAAGLACENGIAVDAHCRTSDPHIFAAGDCSSHPSPHYGRRVRLESVDNAIEQAKSAAANMMDKPTVHDKVPWFWSEQYDLRLQITGLNVDYDRGVVRGDPTVPGFSYCYLRGDELLAIDCVNNPKDFMTSRKLIAERARFDLDRLADAAVGLKDAVKS